MGVRQSIRKRGLQPLCMVRMGFTWSKILLLFALVLFLQQSEAGSAGSNPPKKTKLNSGSAAVPAKQSLVSHLTNAPKCLKKSPSDARTFDINHGQIRACFDYTHQGAIWTYHKIDGKALKTAPNLKRKDNWKTDELGNDILQKSVIKRAGQFYKEVYKKSTQGKGGGKGGQSQKIPIYLARGHLTPNADFESRAKRDATFYFINAAPQWQYFACHHRHQRGLEQLVPRLDTRQQQNYPS